MPYYKLNLTAQSKSNDHEVHIVGEPCYWRDRANHLEDLGWHPSCHDAVREAKRRHPSWRINGCATCAPACHTS